MTNALHAVEERGDVPSQVTVETRLDDGRVNILVKDNGVGITEENLQRIFDPFFSTKGDMGTGLGLSQVYGFVQRSGGGIRVNSQIGVGTQFSLYFPRYYTKVCKEVVTKNKHIDNYQGNETILVVDDEQSLRGLTEEV